MPPSIDELRQEIGLLKAELQSLRRWRKSRADVGKQFDGLIEHYAEQGARHLATEAMRAGQGGAADPLAVWVDGKRIDLGPIMVALLGAAAVRKAMADSLGHVPVGVKDRPARVRQIELMLDQLEGHEEALCVEHDLDRRPDARPEIVLG